MAKSWKTLKWNPLGMPSHITSGTNVCGFQEKRKLLLVFWERPSLFTSDMFVGMTEIYRNRKRNDRKPFADEQSREDRSSEIAMMNGVCIMQSKEVERAGAQKAGRSEECEIYPRNMKGLTI